MNQPLYLGRGSHSKGEGYCYMEMVAYLANEAHSDSPECADPVIASYGRIINDAMGDEIRQSLLSLCVMTVGTNQGENVSRKRADYLLRQTIIRCVVPVLLDHCPKQAEVLKQAAGSGDYEGIERAARAARAAMAADSAAWAARAADSADSAAWAARAADSADSADSAAGL